MKKSMKKIEENLIATCDHSKKIFYGILGIILIVIILSLFIWNKYLNRESKYCVDYLGNSNPSGSCSNKDIDRKCVITEDCSSTCAFGCVTKNWYLVSRNDCTAEPQYECECFNGLCQVK